MVRNGQELSLFAMEEYLKKLIKIADKAKRESDEATNVGTEMIKIHEEFSDIVKSDDPASSESRRKLNDLKKRSARCEVIRKKDLVKLFDKEGDSIHEVEVLRYEIQSMKYRMGVSS